MRKIQRIRGAYGIAPAALTLSLILPAGGAVASPYTGRGQETPKIAVYPYSYNSTWQTPMNKALSNWNATYSPVYLNKSTNSGSTITVKSYTDTWLGYYQKCGPTCMYIRLNSRTISNNASNFSNYVQSVLVHEYGHALGLAHQSSSSIMYTSRNRNTMTSPTSKDVTNVRKAYSTWPNV